MVFRFPKTLDPITLFHNPSSQASKNALATLKRALTAAEAGEAQTTKRGEFQLEVTTAPPTTDQLRNILDYVTGDPAGAGNNRVFYAVEQVVKGARDAEDAVKRFKEGGLDGGFVRPVTVDWTNGRAVVGDNESEILKMVHQLDVD
ncbi:thioredoxin-like protein [Aspergillus coremiiformis]|uniref:Thioredoxin-like protein n=1 Tax=Aspergillus coremiiformis TaxID=138285 RepID=A0A5N6Z0G7_9EURO|nr:thioredoxin-like protein [Aspergillus coremiiformis]